MSKKIIISILAATIALPAFATNENRQGHMYVSGNVGYGFNKIKQTVTETNRITNNTDTNSFHIKTKGFGGSLAVGTHTSKDTRVEGELFYDKLTKRRSTSHVGVNHAYKLHNKTTAGFINAYYDFHNNSMITPYVGAGIGLAKNKLREDHTYTVDNNSTSERFKFKSKTTFAYQFKVGAAIKVAKNADVLLGYSLMQNGKKNIRSLTETSAFYVTKAKLKRDFTHLFSAGVRFTF